MVTPSYCRRLTLVIFLVHGVAASNSSAATPESATEKEISYLLTQLEQSGCEFFRNGEWHAGPAARAHIEKKYQHLKKRNAVKTTEDFIARAASESSMSGEVYQVKCPGKATLPSAQWLNEKLTRFRKTQKTR